MQAYKVRRDGDSNIEDTGGDVDEAGYERVEACRVEGIEYGIESIKYEGAKKCTDPQNNILIHHNR
jgi:hypothetical protein